MDLRFLPVLVLWFCLISCSPTPEECDKMVKVQNLDDPSPLFKRWNFIMGFANHSVYHDLLKTSQSSWTKLGPLGDKQLTMYQSNKMNGHCFYSQTNVTIEGNTAKVELVNVTSDLQVIPTACDTCMALQIHSVAKNLNSVLNLLNYNFTAPEQFTNHAFYLMSSGSAVEQSYLDYFKNQASCLGFHQEPDFIYQPENGFCEENEGAKV